MVKFPVECDSEDCGCPCYEYCKKNMIGVDHFCCDDVLLQAQKEKQKTFEDAINTSSLYTILNTFEIEQHDNLCCECVHEEECPVPEIFHINYPSDSIAKCKFFERFDGNYRYFEKEN